MKEASGKLEGVQDAVAKAADAEFAEHVTSGDPNIPCTAQSYVHVHIRMCTPNCAPPRARSTRSRRRRAPA